MIKPGILLMLHSMKITVSQSIRIINITISGLWSSIILSYIIAVTGGHIPMPYSDEGIYWPMISDTWTTLYGEILSRICIPPFIYTWSIFCWFICDWIDKMSSTMLEYIINTFV